MHAAGRSDDESQRSCGEGMEMTDPPQLPAPHASGGWVGLTSLPLNFWKAGQ